MKVKATNEYEKRKLNSKELNRIPKEGEEFEIEDGKFEMLSGNNKYKAIFVEKVEETNNNDEELNKILNNEKNEEETNKESNNAKQNEETKVSNDKNSKGKNK